MSFYHLTLVGLNQSQQIINTFDYITTSLLPSSEEAAELNAEFLANVMDNIKNVLHANWSATQLYTIAPYSPDVFAQILFTPGSQVGQRAGDQMPRFVSWGFVCSRLRRDIRNGYKRFGPISESDQAGGVPTGTMTPILNTLATELEQVLTLEYVAGSSAATPAIIKRIKYFPCGDPEECQPAYRLPQGLDPLEFYEASNYSFKEITTQNTRKTGRGA